MVRESLERAIEAGLVMGRCLTKQSRIRRAYTVKKGVLTVAGLGNSSFVLMLMLITASVVNANPNASRVDTPITVAELNTVPAHNGTDIVATSPSDEALSLQQSQQIIENLSATNERLSQQLSLKDQQIERLEKQVNPLWSWLFLCFIALSSSVYLMRARLYTKVQQLNIFRSNDRSDLNVIAEQGPADVSINRAAQSSAAGQKTFELAPCYDIESDGTHSDDKAFGIQASVVFDDIDDLSFDQRFEQLLAEKDFAFARELLDFTRYNEINDERYHCERLRLLEKMQDEDGFYEYYYGIESKIPAFPENLQTQISQLVVMLAQR